MSTATKPLPSRDPMAEVIERAIGSNDAYPSPMQIVAHRAKQALREKQFGNQDVTEQTE